MSVSGLCEVCQEPSVDGTCDRCGQLVCRDHFDDELGLCVECAVEAGRPDDPTVPNSEDLPDGVDTYRF